MQRPPATQQNAMATFRVPIRSCHHTFNFYLVQVTFPQGIAYRQTPAYNNRITTQRGPAAGTQLTGAVVQADVQYLQIQNSGGGFVYVPLYSPNGQTLMQAVPQQTVIQQPTMQQSMQQDIGRVQQTSRGRNSRGSNRGYGGSRRGNGCGGYSSSSSCDEGYGGRGGRGGRGGYGGGR